MSSAGLEPHRFVDLEETNRTVSLWNIVKLRRYLTDWSVATHFPFCTLDADGCFTASEYAGCAKSFHTVWCAINSLNLAITTLARFEEQESGTQLGRLDVAPCTALGKEPFFSIEQYRGYPIYLTLLRSTSFYSHFTTVLLLRSLVTLIAAP